MNEGAVAVSARRLIALLAPGSAEAEVSNTQNALFAGLGLVSAVAFPPMIPVGFVREEEAVARFNSLESGGAAPYLFSSLGLRWEGGGLFMAMESRGVWDSLRKLVAGCEDGPFPVAEGFILGCWEAAAETRSADLGEAPSIRFSSCSAALVTIRGAWGRREWWRELYFETTLKKPLR
jgi:hypothetical protein